MSPILESIGSVKGFGWGSFSLPSSFESIATVNGTGSSGTITFSSIPSTYKHLQIRCISNDGLGYTITMNFNNDSGTNYAWHVLKGTGSGVVADGIGSVNSMRIVQENGSISNNFAVYIIDILDYASTSKAKTARVFNGRDQNGSGEVELRSGLWTSTDAINRVDISIGGNFINRSTFALYGIKG